MWTWFTALAGALKKNKNGYPGRTKRRAKVTREEITTLFAKELSRKPIRH